MPYSSHQQKPLYLAFAIIPSIQFHTLYDQYQATDIKFTLRLYHNNNVLQTTKSFGIDEIIKEAEMYLCLTVTNLIEKESEGYSMKMMEESIEKNQEITLLTHHVDLARYVFDHQTNSKDFWTQLSQPTNTKSFTLRLKQRVFLKKTRFQLQDLINSTDPAQQHDKVQMLDHSPQFKKTSKLAIDKRKSKSINCLTNNFFIPPRRLDTISEEDSIVQLTQRKDNNKQKQRQEFFSGQRFKGKQEKVRERFSENVYGTNNDDEFQSQLKRKTTWVENNGSRTLAVDDQFVSVFDHSITEGNLNAHITRFNSLPNNQNPEFDINLKDLKKTNDTEFSHKFSTKVSKLTKTSQTQHEEHEISFLDKSSLLTELQKSELNITQDQKFCFRVKWILLLIVILGLAVFASMSTDAFDVTEGEKDKVKKRKVEGGKHGEVHEIEKKKNKSQGKVKVKKGQKRQKKTAHL